MFSQLAVAVVLFPSCKYKSSAVTACLYDNSYLPLQFKIHNGILLATIRFFMNKYVKII